MRIIASISTIFFNFAFGFLNNQLILDYLDSRSVKFAVVIGCVSKSKQIVLEKSLSSQFRMISVFDINKIDKSILFTKHKRIGVVLDGDCDNSTHFLTECGLKKFFSIKHFWLVIVGNKDLKIFFQNTVINIDADITVAQELENNYKLWDVYNPAFYRGGKLRINAIGYYPDSRFGRIEGLKFWNRKDMSEVTLKSMIVLPVSFSGTLEEYLESDADRNINTFNRFHNSLMRVCRSFYNYNLTIKKVDSWGYQKPDGTFDGIVGALGKDEIDFGSSCLFVRDDRAKFIDYGRLTWVLRAAFIFRKPKQATSIEIFLRPLPTNIWLVTLSLATMSVVALRLSLKLEKRKIKRTNLDPSWSNAIIVTVGAFCQQGTPTNPRKSCGRIVTIFLFGLSYLIYQFYSASIVSSLLQDPVDTIKTIEDISTSSMSAGCEDVLYNRDYFQFTTDLASQHLYKNKIYNEKNNISNFLLPHEGLQLVKKGDYAFHVELATAYPIIEDSFDGRSICQLREIQMYRTQPMHANYGKNSPFKDMFDTCLQRLGEIGVIKRERNHWHPRKPECVLGGDSSAFNVGLDDFYPALMALIIGVFGSILILLLELFCSRKVGSKSSDITLVIPYLE